jgi:uncharacterized membrane protein YkoI
MEERMRLLTIGIFSALMAGIAASPATFGAEKAKASRHLTADQAMTCIKMASGARAGNITKLEIDVDDGRTICEVHLEDAKGKNFEAHVDVAANKVLRVKD